MATNYRGTATLSTGWGATPEATSITAKAKPMMHKNPKKNLVNVFVKNLGFTPLFYPDFTARRGR